MNPICDNFPVFPNIWAAYEAIRHLEGQAEFCEGILPPFWNERKEFTPFDTSGFEVDDFIFNQLQLNRDDVEYYGLFNIEDGTPYLEQFTRFSLKPCLFNSKFLFRGQSKDYHSLKPSMLRDDSKNYFLEDCIREQELSAFMAQHPLIQLLGIKGVEIAGRNVKLQANLYGLAQHYYNSTLLIDFSSSLDVAAFFAVTKLDSDSDSYLPVDLDSESIGLIYALPIHTALTYNKDYGFPVSSIGKQFTLERPSRQLGFLVEAERGRDLIDHPYLLKFRFYHNKEISKFIYNNWAKGMAIAPPDFVQKHWRNKKDYKSKTFEVSEKALALNVYKNRRESRESIIEKLSHYKLENGKDMFRLSGREWPEFPREIIEEYKADIRNGWWEDVFCDNLFFPMQTKRFRDEFLNLPKDPRYKDYF